MGYKEVESWKVDQFFPVKQKRFAPHIIIFFSLNKVERSPSN